MAWVDDARRRFWTVSVSDRFGDAGLTGLVSIECDGARRASSTTYSAAALWAARSKRRWCTWRWTARVNERSRPSWHPTAPPRRTSRASRFGAVGLRELRYSRRARSSVGICRTTIRSRGHPPHVGKVTGVPGPHPKQRSTLSELWREATAAFWLRAAD